MPKLGILQKLMMFLFKDNYFFKKLFRDDYECFYPKVYSRFKKCVLTIKNLSITKSYVYIPKDFIAKDS